MNPACQAYLLTAQLAAAAAAAAVAPAVAVAAAYSMHLVEEPVPAPVAKLRPMHSAAEVAALAAAVVGAVSRPVVEVVGAAVAARGQWERKIDAFRGHPIHASNSIAGMTPCNMGGPQFRRWNVRIMDRCLFARADSPAAGNPRTVAAAAVGSDIVHAVVSRTLSKCMIKETTIKIRTVAEIMEGSCMTGAGGATWDSTVRSFMSSPTIQIRQMFSRAAEWRSCRRSATLADRRIGEALAFEDDHVISI
eukprot:353000-Chlamydomonas_euryale.AAC.7